MVDLISVDLSKRLQQGLPERIEKVISNLSELILRNRHQSLVLSATPLSFEEREAIKRDLECWGGLNGISGAKQVEQEMAKREVSRTYLAKVFSEKHGLSVDDVRNMSLSSYKELIDQPGMEMARTSAQKLFYAYY